MRTFLDEVLQKESDLENTILIVPSRRAGNVLLKKITSLSSHTSFAPEIFSIEEFIEHITGLKPIHPLDAVLVLYESYLEIVSVDKQVSLSTFCGWAPSILSDFNEIDRYLLDQSTILNHLKDIKEMSDHWSSSSSDIIVNYIDFWNNLYDIYSRFCEKSIQAGSIHQGYIYRDAAENVEHYLNISKNKRHVFIGFNALNTAEQQLIQSILAQGNAEIFWDTELSLQSNKYHETNIFISNYRKTWKHFTSNEFYWSFNNYVDRKNISTYGCSQNVLQVKTLGTILSKLTNEQWCKTAIVLGDESLLLPIINSLPDNIDKVNVTMGFPLSKTPTASFFSKLFLLKKKTSTKKGYYYKDVLDILRDPLVRMSNSHDAELLEKAIIEKNIIYLTAKSIDNITDQSSESLFKLLFSEWSDNIHRAVQNCIDIIEEFRKNINSKNDPLQLEFLYGFSVAFTKLKHLTESEHHIKDITTLIYFYRDILLSETIDLRGDQDEGLQIMGVLESRVLDFENVIITSVNEGVFPSGKSQNSNIPYDLKKLYQLPTYAEKDAIYAYHFYHLLHRAKNIDLLYVTHSDGLGSSERSRFIRQMEEENIHSINKYIVTPPILKSTLKDIEVQKTEAVIEKLTLFFKKGASPSSLSTFLRDPILFHERYVLGINDSGAVEETVAANTMGTIVHNTLEELYRPLVGLQLTVNHLESISKGIDKEVHKQFKDTYGLDYINEGKNKIIYAIVKRYLHNYIARELDLLKKGDNVQIISVELDLRDIQLSNNITLKGKVDLIEIRNGCLNIVDYKTGKVEGKHLKLTTFEDLLQPEGSFEKAFQVLMYAYMLSKVQPLEFPIQAGIISFKNLRAGFIPFQFDKNAQITEQTLAEFESVLIKLIDQILDKSVPFTRV